MATSLTNIEMTNTLAKGKKAKKNWMITRRFRNRKGLECNDNCSRSMCHKSLQLSRMTISWIALFIFMSECFLIWVTGINRLLQPVIVGTLMVALFKFKSYHEWWNCKCECRFFREGDFSQENSPNAASITGFCQGWCLLLAEKRQDIYNLTVGRIYVRFKIWTQHAFHS